MIAGVDEFKKLTGYDIEAFLNDFVAFSANNYQSIVDYYSGGTLISEAFKEMDRLIGESNRIEAIMELNADRLKTNDHWVLVETIGDIQVNLWTCQNMSKWTRSSRLNQYDSSITVEKGLRQFETFETVAKEAGSLDSDNEWSNIAIDNLITEEDYTTEGGKIFWVKLQNSYNYGIPNIVDSLSGETIYGKDIVKKFEFVGNDLATISGNDAIKQSLSTKLDTVKGSIPEFPDRGVDPQSTSTNVNSIQYPSIFRNLLNLFQDDARWKEVNLLDLYREDDAVFMKFEVKTILKDSFLTNLKI
jgi:hypothetical protein